MQQYWGIKDQHEDKVLFFRMGDFFEMFADDAELAAPILGIALTVRNKKSGDDTKMCGMPHHSIAGAVSKLLSAGHKVAICDQVEDPKLAKGLVKRAVTRVLTPGMVYDPETLDELSSHYLCGYDEQTLSFLDVTTKEAFSYRFTGSAEREELIALLNPVEFVLSGAQKRERMSEFEMSSKVLSVHEVLDQQWSGAESEQRLIAYVRTLQGEQVLTGLKKFELRRLKNHMRLSATTMRHLEIFQTYKGDKEGSLFVAINRTKTSAGARLLKSRLQFPLIEEEQISERQARVSYWKSDYKKLGAFRSELSGVGDLERRLSKLSQPTCNARDLQNLAASLEAGLCAQRLAPQASSEALSNMQLVGSLVERVGATLKDEPPASVKEGAIIRDGVSPKLDEYIKLTKDSQSLLLEMEAAEKQKTGIPSLKIRYNNVFGFYLEVTKTHSDKVPKHYVRKQTLTNAERYITDELQKLEDKILSAKTKRNDLEFEIFEELRHVMLKASVEITALARMWSEHDVDSSLAYISLESNYCQPQFSKVRALQLKACRHPVIEQALQKSFVPNDISLQPSGCLLLTGPNMAGKSTLMRQVAINALLAQIGSDVACESAVLPVYDQIFTRIGASDHLTEGLSTFMVEMTETAHILKTATSQSLLVLDEIGRGTSTYDGMSLAQSILEHLVKNKKCMTLFATHYHELVELETKFESILNGHMSIVESNGEIEFLHTLRQGAALKSYGIGVARLAGLPKTLLSRAEGLMKLHETRSSKPQIGFEDFLLDAMGSGESNEEAAVDPALQQIADELKALNLPQMTPLDVMNRIAQWQKELS
ncbi:MAG: DNA mismatch repair protein MutS [Bdellovibrionales bacterium]|nr:DNA mismatch repair protein MutS [Bdellovibrionales bacterium]